MLDFIRVMPAAMLYAARVVANEARIIQQVES